MDRLWHLLDKRSDLQCNIPSYSACKYDNKMLHHFLSVPSELLLLELNLYCLSIQQLDHGVSGNFCDINIISVYECATFPSVIESENKPN